MMQSFHIERKNMSMYLKKIKRGIKNIASYIFFFL